MALNENIVREQDARISKMVNKPTFLVVPGALPGLFAATSHENGLVIGAVTAAAILVMALIAPALPAFAGTWARTAVMLMVSVTVVTPTGQVFGLTMGELAASPIAAFGKPTGSLLVLALVAVFVQSIEQVCAKGADADATCAEGGER